MKEIFKALDASEIVLLTLLYKYYNGVEFF